jgi:hypothetical protein
MNGVANTECITAEEQKVPEMTILPRMVTIEAPKQADNVAIHFSWNNVCENV